ncbi:unnamed protein product [Blepharisma stoltei]|uniref:Uncharacterized protein n=1 Tax=Blepharisma stoltei TaxID=1481888 RepID=A0AAU9IQ95_9CILI|nr:unnamed protein product [Blepharisma stoltei]
MTFFCYFIVLLIFSIIAWLNIEIFIRKLHIFLVFIKFFIINPAAVILAELISCNEIRHGERHELSAKTITIFIRLLYW